MSPRGEASFTAINCAAIPEQLLESELFGHVKGAFTGATADRAGLFELAHEGTLLLDEIGDLPLDLQAKLLRVLEEGEIRRVGGARAAQGRRPRHRRHGQAARGGGRARRVPRRPLLPAQRGPAPHPAAPRAARGRAAAAHPLRAPGRHPAGPPGEHHPVGARRADPPHLARQRPRAPQRGRARRGARHRWSARAARLRAGKNGNGNGRPMGEANGVRYANGTGSYGDQGGPLDLKTQVEAVERLAILRALEASGGNRRQAASPARHQPPHPVLQDAAVAGPLGGSEAHRAQSSARDAGRCSIPRGVSSAKSLSIHPFMSGTAPAFPESGRAGHPARTIHRWRTHGTSVGVHAGRDAARGGHHGRDVADGVSARQQRDGEEQPAGRAGRGWSTCCRRRARRPPRAAGRWRM